MDPEFFLPAPELSTQEALGLLLLAFKAEVIRRFGKPTLSPLRAMADNECEQALISLPGIGKKTARCVMMSHIHLPFKNSALWAVLKIEGNLPDKIKRYCNTVLQNISIKANPQFKFQKGEVQTGCLQESLFRPRPCNSAIHG